jgi:hypothetical protein
MYKRIAVSSAVPFRAPLLGHILFFRLLELVHIIRTAMTILGSIARQPTEVRLVGSDRVRSVVVELAKFPNGASLDEMARAVTSPQARLQERGIMEFGIEGLGNQRQNVVAPS